MTEKSQAGVLASLPRTRPHRRSDKRSPAGPAAETPQAPAEPARTAAKPASRARTAKAQTTKAQTTKATAAKPAGKARAAKATAAKPRAKAPAERARSDKPEAAAGARRTSTSQSGPGHHTQPRTQAPRRTGSRPSTPDPAAGPLGTAVQAAAELAEIGMMASARALRGALSRLPRP